MPQHLQIELRLFLHLTLMSCYIAPSDSQFHSFAPLAEMKNKMSTSPQEKFNIIGDMNARFGESRTGFSKENSPFVRVNGDTCLISPEYISAITSFEVHQTPLLRSDHAPINLNINREKCRSQPEDLTETLLRAENLHSIQTATSANEEVTQKRKPIRMHEFDQDMIREELRGAETPALEPFKQCHLLHAWRFYTLRFVVILTKPFNEAYPWSGALFAAKSGNIAE
ncbi:hypothetical protein CAPTEDRAFT_186420 [Capitella teleta]|uniref:Endonuclease/exonuclease/phosphatase domain-containing protein n=1 Tax=Capitella teleta TaxID=283909 RepID=R7U3F8_CAPTE|nr:hypothetical protein CAPTEDRAFT_186420 [Capitella teleta]|eukprot:ELU00494.1 hypothetical protein CAPTEDRAFT_186420 [Capitella teleta]